MRSDKAPVLKLQPDLVALIGLALAESGSPSVAAKRLGLSLRDLRTRLRQYGMLGVLPSPPRAQPRQRVAR